MNNEIKEILDDLENLDFSKESLYDLTEYEIKKVLDYITNLQQCYCNRTDCSGRIKNSKKYDSVYQEKEDYKSRVDKATKELFELKDMTYKAETRKENFLIQRKISSIIKSLYGADKK